MRRLEVYDIETLANLFTYTGYNPETQEYKQFVIHNLRNDLNEFYDYLVNGNLYQIGFNNEGFDYPVLHNIIKHYPEYRYMSASEVAGHIYRKSQDVIEMEFSAIADKHKYIPQLDLYSIHHYKNHARRCSLKQIEIALRLDNVEDMPIDHRKWITSLDEIELVLAYNKNDVFATWEFYKVTKGNTELPLYKGKDMLALRKHIMAEFGLPCMNYNDVQIGDELNKLNYLKNNPGTYLIKGGTQRKSIKLSECILPNIKFESDQLNEFLCRLKTIEIDCENLKFEEKITYKGVKFSFGLGGIHSEDKPGIIIPNENQKLEDRDCTSMHPSIILKYGFYPEHLGISWLNGYQWTFDQRVYNKKLSKDKSLPFDVRKSHESIQEAFKLSLNGGGFGKTGEKNSWQHDDKVMLSVTVNNQLFLLMLAETYLNNGFDVKSCNTDGIVLLFNKSDQEKVNEIDHNWEQLSKHTLEYTEYSKFVQTSVNDYITLKPDGQCKFKGDFAIDRELHKNQSMIIVAKALKEYFINGIPVKDTILNHRDIYDFCLTLRLNQGWEANYHYLEDNVVKKLPLSRTTRYYISTNNSCIIKSADALEKDRIKGKLKRNSQVNVGYSMTLFNRYIEKPFNEYNIDYNFYIAECNKIIDQIEVPKTQLTLF